MLYVYFGTDGKKINDALSGALATLREKVPHAHVARVTGEDEIDMHEILGAQGLFYSKRVVVFDGVLGSKEVREEVFKHLKEMKESEHIFFIKEGRLHPAHERMLKQHAEKVEEHAIQESRKQKAESRNDFALANAFGTRKKLESWKELHRALSRGAAPEALHGMLFWKVKDMSLKKAGGTHWSEGELKSAVEKLAVLPQESRRKGVELEYALELFLLR